MKNPAYNILPLVFCAVLAYFSGPALAQVRTPVDNAYFTRDIKPLMEQNCLGCHGVGGTRLSGLDMRSRESLLKGGTRGKSFIAGNAATSTLYQLVSGVRAPLMPPTGKMPNADIAKLKRWIDGGAPWPGGAIESASKQIWWSFKPPVKPAIPLIQSPKSKIQNPLNPIDAFIVQKLQSEGLAISPAAPRRILIRRAYLDLLGLPPTPEEVRAFENDRTPNAWEKVVDRLLASPHYGERWGRHWLDLVRYADSGGFEGDKDRPLAYRYRDYVIDSFNKDKPYDRFIREQIAGDELTESDPARRNEAIIATGYLACGPQDIVEMNARTRSNELDDLVATTGSVFLGLTIGCARCHDHKYDPVKQTDYYRLSACFAPTERREIEVPTPEEARSAALRNADIDRRAAPLLAKIEPLRTKGREAALKLKIAKPTDDQIKAALPDPDRKSFADLLGQIAALESKRSPLPKALAVTDKGRTFDKSYLLIRGDAYHQGDEVQAGFICSLPGGETVVGPDAATDKTTGRRKELADWLANSRNPLTARVWVNRIWRQHFGRGIVNSSSNFGLNGDLPTHPELLDWLATTLMNEDERGNMSATSLIPHPSSLAFGWRAKPLHKLILMSRAWQQSSAIRADALEKDPQNRYVWRMPVRRLEAEAIRDSLLAVAGTLNFEIGGPAVYPPVDPSLRADTFQGFNWPVGEDSPKTWRRSVYVKVKRSLLLPQLEVFDCPEITYTVAQRNVTTTPLQALMLLNDPLILRQASLFAERLQRECGKDLAKQIDRAYTLCFGRAATQKETLLSSNFLKTRSLVDFCHAIINLNEFVYVQ